MRGEITIEPLLSAHYGKWRGERLKQVDRLLKFSQIRGIIKKIFTTPPYTIIDHLMYIAHRTTYSVFGRETWIQNYLKDYF